MTRLSGLGQVLAHRIPVDRAPAHQAERPFRREAHIGLEDRRGDPPEKLEIAERRPAASVVEIEVVDPKSLLIDQVIDDARIDGHHRRGVVVHEMPADRVGAVRETAFPGSEQQRGRIDGAGGERDEFRADCAALAAVQDLDACDALAVWLDKQPFDVSVGAKLDVGIRQRFFDAADLGVHLAVPGVGKRVPRRFPALQPFVEVDAERQGERVQADALQASTAIDVLTFMKASPIGRRSSARVCCGTRRRPRPDPQSSRSVRRPVLR